MSKLFEALKQVLHGVEAYHDSYTMRHEENTGVLMKALGLAMGLDADYCNDLKQAGSMHDIGKLALPAQILEKPSALNSFERQVVEMHPVIGKKMLSNIKHRLTDFASGIIIAHHERFDGAGYPNGLKGKDIPIEARICSVCDVYEAMRAARPYRENLATHQAVVKKMLSKKTDGLFYRFDPEILNVFSDIHKQFNDIYCSRL